MGIPHSKLTNLYYNDKVAFHIIKNPLSHEQTERIEVDCHLIRDEIQQNCIQLTYVSTHSELVDLFTKPISATQFWFIFRFGSFLDRLDIYNLHASPEGGNKNKILFVGPTILPLSLYLLC